MSVESFNTIELRYADSVLAAHRFVRDSDYKTLEEENEILRAERTHWHNMYNAESAPANEMLEQ